MQALIRENSFLPELCEIPEPQIDTSDQVKIRIVYGTICRDDIREQDELNVMSRKGIVGHEATGIIVESGILAQANGFTVGARVSVMIIDFCGHCKYCLTRVPQYCPEVRLTSGIFAQYIIKRYQQLVLVPDTLTFAQASLIEPIGDILEGISKLQLNFNSRVLIIGAGFIGLSLLKLLRNLGIKWVTVAEPLAERRALALTYGAEYALDPNDVDLSLQLLKQTGFYGFDVAIDTSAQVNIVDFAIPSLRRGGTLLMLAYGDSQSKISFQSLDVYTHNISIIWSCICGAQNMENAAEMIKRLSLEQLITAEYPLALGKQAFSEYMGTTQIKIGIRFPDDIGHSYDKLG